MFLIPGVVLLARDMCMQVSNIMTGKRMKAGFMSDLQSGEKPKDVVKNNNVKMFQRCWDTYHCKESLRKVCPAYKSRKSCWRVKSGCFCDENLLMRSIISTDSQNDFAKRTIERLDGNKPALLNLTKAQK